MSSYPDDPGPRPCLGSLGQLPRENAGQFPWRYAAALIIACVIAAMLVLPYEIELERRNAEPEGTLLWKPAEFALYVDHEDQSHRSYRWGPLEILAALVMGMLWPLLAIFFGLKLGPAVALAWPPMADWGAGQRWFRRSSSTLLLAVALGIASVVVLWVSALVLLSGSEDEAKHIVQPLWWVGMLASLGAGIREEVWLRLGVMTTVVWIVAKLTRQKSPGPATIWSGIVTASLLFGALHLPSAGSLLRLSGPLIAYVLVGSGGIGLIFGWLYWRKGLIAAMVAHTTQDLITKAIFPLLGL